MVRRHIALLRQSHQFCPRRLRFTPFAAPSGSFEVFNARLDAGLRHSEQMEAPFKYSSWAAAFRVPWFTTAPRWLRGRLGVMARWADTVVEETNLTQNISILRRALGEHRGDHRYIATVPGRGYQFVAKVRIAGESPAQREPTAGASMGCCHS